MIDNKVAYSWARNSHIAGGMAWIFGGLTLFGQTYLVYLLATGLALCAVKEFWYDQNYETPDERGSNLEDFLEYSAGFLAALILYYAKLFIEYKLRGN